MLEQLESTYQQALNELDGVRDSAVYTGHFGADPHLTMEEGRQAISRGVPIAKARV